MNIITVNCLIDRDIEKFYHRAVEASEKAGYWKIAQRISIFHIKLRDKREIHR
ncbi:MAG: hypothetical protein JETT_1898 [Candidatus Jettenia ecosi]|uniref:Uncharacterized protein n=1 Tax=Candidatus Jettenia ecosi TaxID=2494326 RepID=A0A533QAS0_9BACT|nr:MAG: hypothetical protein JETT_1898 [Candidatus Jettenia ecosi]